MAAAAAVLDKPVGAGGGMSDETDTGANALGAVVVHQYVLGEPLDWDDDCEAEMRGQTMLWNRFVEIEHERRERYFALTAEDPQVADAETAVRILMDELADLKQRRIAKRSEQRSRWTPEDDARVRTVKLRLKAATEHAKTARRTARQNMKPALEALDRERIAKVKQAYQQSGLWWGSYQAVIASYEAARRAALKAKPPGELKFRAFRGEGRIVNPFAIRNEAIDKRTGRVVPQRLPPTVEDLQAGVIARAKLIPGGLPPTNRMPGSRRSRLVDYSHSIEVTVFMRDKVRKTCRWPIFINRPLPPGAFVKLVTIHRRPVADTYRWTATITMRDPTVQAPAPRPEMKVLALDLGWRHVEGGLRVATIVDSDGHKDFTLLPEKFLEVHEWLRGQESHRSHLHAEILKLMVGLPWEEAPAPLRAIADWHRQIPAETIKPRNTLRLILAWREHAPGWQEEVYGRLEEWRRHDKRVWQRIDHRRTRLARERLDFYRKEAKRIVAAADAIVINKLDLARLRRQSSEHVPVAVERAIKRNSFIAAPGLLQQWIKDEAAKRGTAIRYHEGRTIYCSACGRSPDGMATIQNCPCGRTYDVDLEACGNMLADGAATIPVAAE